MISLKRNGRNQGDASRHGWETAGTADALIYRKMDPVTLRGTSGYGGLAKQMPMYATIFLITALSSMGLPALNGFIGEFTILLGAANRSHRAGAALLHGIRS